MFDKNNVWIRVPANLNCLSGESGKLEADAVADASANSGGNRGGKDIKEGKDGGRGEGKKKNFLHLEGLWWKKVGNDGNDEAFNEVFNNASDSLLDIEWGAH